MPDHFRVRVTKDHLVFSAAHFITIDGDVCERLHGHNWRVATELAGGPLNENEYLFDFIALRDAMQEIVDRLDHRMLVAVQHPTIGVTESDAEVELTHGERRWVFPKDECILLPIENTTAELLASWITDELLGRLPLVDVGWLDYIQVEVEENFGQWAICRRPLGD